MVTIKGLAMADHWTAWQNAQAQFCKTIIILINKIAYNYTHCGQSKISRQDTIIMSSYSA